MTGTYLLFAIPLYPIDSNATNIVTKSTILQTYFHSLPVFRIISMIKKSQRIIKKLNGVGELVVTLYVLVKKGYKRFSVSKKDKMNQGNGIKKEQTVKNTPPEIISFRVLCFKTASVIKSINKIKNEPIASNFVVIASPIMMPLTTSHVDFFDSSELINAHNARNSKKVLIRSIYAVIDSQSITKLE